MNIPIYNEADLSKLPKGLYVGLFHGRDSEDEELDDWGFDGPLIGPLRYFHTTYGVTRRGAFVKNTPKELIEQYVKAGIVEKTAGTVKGIVKFWYEYIMNINKDGSLVVCAGKYYGDWTVFYNEEGY